MEGFIQIFHSAIFVELEEQLNTNPSTISSVISARAVAMGCAVTLFVPIIDFFDEFHRFVAVITFGTGCCIAVIPWISSIIQLLFVFVAVGVFSWRRTRELPGVRLQSIP